MSDVLKALQDKLFIITLNRVTKHNAFDDELLIKLQLALDEAQQNPEVRVIILKANGEHFSAGADIGWMQRMVNYTEQENLADAKILSNVMYSLYHSNKPTLAMVQGYAIGGGAGLVAACDIAIAAHNARFCFSETKLGLIPAVISPYVLRAIGERSTAALFMSAETFDARRALELKLIHHCVAPEQLQTHTLDYAKQIASLAPGAVSDCKVLIKQVANRPIDETLQNLTASVIAKKRISKEAQIGLQAFLNKETPNWN